MSSSNAAINKPFEFRSVHALSKMETDHSNLKEKIHVYLTKCLKNFDKNFRVEIGEDIAGGSLSHTFILKAIGESGKTLDIVAKRAKEVTGTFKKDITQAYQSETVFYTKVLPTFLKFHHDKTGKEYTNIPLCYGTISNEEEEIVFMENLKAKNYKLNDLRHAMTLEHVKLVIKSYAEWHAITMAFNDQNPEKFKELSKGFETFWNTELFTNVYRSAKNGTLRVADLYESKQNLLYADRLRKCVKEFDEKLIEVNDYKGPLVWKHGDNWNNNHMFQHKDEDEIPVHHKLLDWQISGPGSPVNDLCVFLYMCSSKTELEHFDNLLKMYHDVFSKKMVELGNDPNKLFPFDFLVNQWKKTAFLGVQMMPMCCQFRGKQDVKYYDVSYYEVDDKSDPFYFEVRDGPPFEEMHGIFEHVIQRDLI